jgi:Flp pilus assembly protein TadG
VLVLLILLPLFVVILQLGLALYVRNTLAACTQEGARYGADEDFVVQGPEAMTAQAVDRTTGCINAALSSTFSQAVTASTPVIIDSAGVQVRVVEVRTASPVPVIGMFGLGTQVLHVHGDAMQELP